MESAQARRRRKGFHYERELARTLWRKGFACMRAPASGAKVKRVKYPDVVAIKNGVTLVFEVKTRSKPGAIYIERKQVEKIVEFASRAGGRAFIAVRVLDGRGWRFVPVEELEETRGGNYKVSEEVLENKSLSLEELIRMADKTAKLDQFM